ncbi:hypothetical protein POM88_028879 [Heracleum sosnowskyi]|uniref:Uncharacterized protein n=1 Tax=Heracleum sosnowskyi TaxID=360622 RepID=A0AAD8HTQ0_9APIA|nr:hypothetical protein POM88_028879 [Heracleum sosnowskyi]
MIIWWLDWNGGRWGVLDAAVYAISENTEEGFRNIIYEPSPGVLTFDMLQPQFCKMLVDEVENFENWVRETRTRILRPNTMNTYGSVLGQISGAVSGAVSSIILEQFFATFWTTIMQIFGAVYEEYLMPDPFPRRFISSSSLCCLKKSDVLCGRSQHK